MQANLKPFLYICISISQDNKCLIIFRILERRDNPNWKKRLNISEEREKKTENLVTAYFYANLKVVLENKKKQNFPL